MSGTSMEDGDEENYDAQDTGESLGMTLDTYVNQVKAGETPVYENDLYAGLSGNTTNALSGSVTEAYNPDYLTGVSGAMDYYSDVAAGHAYGTDDPGYAQLRSDLIDDTMSAVNSTFTTSGRFGSGSHVNSAAEGVGNSVAALDYANYQSDIARQAEAVNMLTTLYGQAQAPYQTQLAAGQAQDADAQAALLADYDLFERTNNADYDRMQELFAMLSGSQDNAGMGEDKEWWETLLTYIGNNAATAASVV